MLHFPASISIQILLLRGVQFKLKIEFNITQFLEYSNFVYYQILVIQIVTEMNSGHSKLFNRIMIVVTSFTHPKLLFVLFSTVICSFIFVHLSILCV